MTQRQQQDETLTVQITVRGRLDDRWSDWFNGMEVSTKPQPTGAPVTTLTGTVDQTALRGIANKIWDLNLTLVSITPLDD